MYNNIKVGIDSVQFYIPSIYLSIEDLANKRNIDPGKLSAGLGLQKMSLPDKNEDPVSMASSAVFKLMKQEGLTLADISRIYVGTESGIDNSKPIASYVHHLMSEHFASERHSNCDAVDYTFACIGAVDAFQNCIDYVRLNPDKKAIVVATDFAKYDLESTGEYTQGAGAIAVLISASPRILSFTNEIGISTEGVFDFFKPKQFLQKNRITKVESNENWEGFLETEIPFVKDQPVFDGQYSNSCYISRIKDAFADFKYNQHVKFEGIDSWDLICMHLPYCFQGRRTFIELFAQERADLLALQEGADEREKLRALSKSDAYKALITEKISPSEIASGEIGNLYTGSIFLGLISALYYSAKEGKSPSRIGFIAYGSGSKAKVFEGVLEENWNKQIEKINLFETLEARMKIDFDTYEKLHRKELSAPITSQGKYFVLDKIEAEEKNLMGARYYRFVG